MRRFAELFRALDETTRVNPKVEAMALYFREADPADRLWTVALLSGRRPKRTVNATRLREWAAERAGIPLWLFEESYPIVGDLAETIALVLPEPTALEDRPLSHWIDVIRGLARLEEPARKAAVLAAWDALGGTERFLFTKLITGQFRVGVSQKLMSRALAQATGTPEPEIALRLMGDWTPDTATWRSLIEAPDPSAVLSRPYPFYLAYQIEPPSGSDEGPRTAGWMAETLGPPEDWQAEFKWDGIRGQLVLRGGAHHLWSRGEELVTDRFPEMSGLRDFVPDGTVIDGEVLAWNRGDALPLPFARLQTRIGRKTVPKKVLADAPAILRAYDLLEWEGRDIRERPLAERRGILETLVSSMPSGAPLTFSEAVPFDGWEALAEARATSRALGAEGLMLKRKASPYLAGRKKGDWWKWKVDPLVIDAVMVYAQQGHGRRAGLFTDFTFAVWSGDQLVPFTKAYSGLTDAEFRRITHWVRRNTLERYGPVRHVRPELVFEIAFEGIQESARHKSGVALRFPRMARWRHDKPAAEANTLADLQEMLAAHG